MVGLYLFMSDATWQMKMSSSDAVDTLLSFSSAVW